MLRDYLYKELNYFVIHHEFQRLVSEFGKTHLYVEECIEGTIRVIQKKIYSLYDTFDNHRFQDDEWLKVKGRCVNTIMRGPIQNLMVGVLLLIRKWKKFGWYSWRKWRK